MVGFSLSSWRLDAAPPRPNLPPRRVPQWLLALLAVGLAAAALAVAVHSLGRPGQWGARLLAGAPTLWGELVPVAAVLGLAALGLLAIVVGPCWFCGERHLAQVCPPPLPGVVRRHRHAPRARAGRGRLAARDPRPARAKLLVQRAGRRRRARAAVGARLPRLARCGALRLLSRASRRQGRAGLVLPDGRRVAVPLLRRADARLRGGRRPAARGARRRPGQLRRRLHRDGPARRPAAGVRRQHQRRLPRPLLSRPADGGLHARRRRRRAEPPRASPPSPTASVWPRSSSAPTASASSVPTRSSTST